MKNKSYYLNELKREIKSQPCSITKIKKIVLEMESNNIDINSKTYNGRTLLHYAVINNQKRLVRLFIKLGINPEICDDNYNTPLHLAVVKNKYQIIEVTAVIGENLEELLKAISHKLDELPPKKPLEFEPFVYTRPDENRYEISREDDGAYVLSGGFIDELIRNVVVSDYTSFAYFQKVLKEKGIMKELRRRGLKDGSIIRVKDMDFEYFEGEE